MARKTFISYKYSEAIEVRDKIIECLGEDARYYTGERSESPNISDTTTENIKNKLKEMIYATSVTILIISPNMKLSEWIEWEIGYSLKKITRDGRTSNINGVVGVIMKENGAYDWLKKCSTQSDGCNTCYYDKSKLPAIISENICNHKPLKYSCKKCESLDELTQSFISLIEEEEFLKNPTKYIKNAYDKSQNTADFDLCRQGPVPSST